jgi:predicted RNA-binding Zn-ribbon protein involved in translation (DUF1610 family)
MTKNTTVTGVIEFHCRCQLIEPGHPDDTLMAEEYVDAGSSNKHDVFIENSPFDLAANKVLKDCPNCGLNFMILIRIGPSESVMYVCSCGYKAAHSEYIKQVKNH